MKPTALILAVLIIHSVVEKIQPFPGDGSKAETYDFVVVGGGTAGCVVASRLAENPRWKVLVLEAGAIETFNMGIPLNVLQLQQNQAISWKHQTKASKKQSYCLAMKHGQCNWPFGKVMGGSSVLDDMIHSRGNPKDFDDWHQAGWSYAEVLPYFKKLENNSCPDADQRSAGKEGPITISYPQWRSPLAAAFIKAGSEVGMPKVDYNGGQQIGFSYVQTTTKRGIRQSTHKAYIASVEPDPKDKKMLNMIGRENLHIRQFVKAPRLMMDKLRKKVWGVQYESLGHTHVVFAKHEVILSAGVIGTTGILMRAGIGPLDHLQAAGIKPVKLLPVGLKLMDPVAVGGLTFFTNTTVLDLEALLSIERLQAFEHTHEAQLSSPGGVEALAFFDTKPHGDNDGVPDIEVLVESKSMLGHSVLKNNHNLDPHLYDIMYRSVEHFKNHAFTLTPIVLQPLSRGWITLADSGPYSTPQIHPNYFHHPEDIRTAVRGIRICLALVKTKAFRAIGAELHYVPVPGCKHHAHNSDEYWECYARYFTISANRQSGSNHMGEDGVVDARLKLHGIDGVRIVDAGVMPKGPAGHSSTTVVMIAEKAADMIKQEYSATYKVHEEEIDEDSYSEEELHSDREVEYFELQEPEVRHRVVYHRKEI